MDKRRETQGEGWRSRKECLLYDLQVRIQIYQSKKNKISASSGGMVYSPAFRSSNSPDQNSLQQRHR